MGVRQLANTPENWVFDISRFSLGDVEKIFNAIQAGREHITAHEVLVTPNRGHERAVRYICGSLFKRVKGTRAKEILERFKTYRTATTS